MPKQSEGLFPRERGDILPTSSSAVYALNFEQLDPVVLSVNAKGQAAASSQPLYMQPGSNVEDRVDDLLGRMTIQEKVSQLDMYSSAREIVNAHTDDTHGMGLSYTTFAYNGLTVAAPAPGDLERRTCMGGRARHYTIWVGGSSEATLRTGFDITSIKA